ncbi:hypothetical protein [Candidatus Chloroploca sp. Khr17]|uniref:hypothetical protein n=1 Tax=Candidatus Chloroploca sp. Khr17 TaxID=2496869 RepID=UPI00101BCCAF|nr:hypothetical protein [Candidatus Chloroploca sp. Khr17]
MSTVSPGTITLVGRTSAWQQRLPAGAADRGFRPPQPARGARPFYASWLHHPAYGTLGVALAPDAEGHGLALRRGQWVQLTGVVRPHFAVALPDDPRSAQAISLAPLLIDVTQVRLVSRNDDLPPLTVTPALQVRVLPPAPDSPTTLLPLASWADAVYWRSSATTATVSVAWNRVRGVVTPSGSLRYLRYVLSLDAPRQ